MIKGNVRFEVGSYKITMPTNKSGTIALKEDIPSNTGVANKVQIYGRDNLPITKDHNPNLTSLTNIDSSGYYMSLHLRDYDEISFVLKGNGSHTTSHGSTAKLVLGKKVVWSDTFYPDTGNKPHPFSYLFLIKNTYFSFILIDIIDRQNGNKRQTIVAENNWAAIGNLEIDHTSNCYYDIEFRLDDDYAGNSSFGGSCDYNYIYKKSSLAD